MTDLSPIPAHRRQQDARSWRRSTWILFLASLLAAGAAASHGQTKDEPGSTSRATPGSRAQTTSPTTWLVMTNGDRLELQEPWTVDASGRRVLYRPVGGVLRTVRASEVDFEASRQPAIAAQPTEQPPADADKTPALVLKDGDVGAFDAQTAAPRGAEQPRDAEAALSSTPDEASRPRAADHLEVVSFSDISEPGGEQVVIYGTVRNTGIRPANRAFVRVSLLDERGEPLATSPARLVRTSIAAGRTSNFQVTFNTPTPYASVEFNLGHE